MTAGVLFSLIFGGLVGYLTVIWLQPVARGCIFLWEFLCNKQRFDIIYHLAEDELYDEGKEAYKKEKGKGSKYLPHHLHVDAIRAYEPYAYKYFVHCMWIGIRPFLIVFFVFFIVSALMFQQYAYLMALGFILGYIVPACGKFRFSDERELAAFTLTRWIIDVAHGHYRELHPEIVKKYPLKPKYSHSIMDVETGEKIYFEKQETTLDRLEELFQKQWHITGTTLWYGSAIFFSFMMALNIAHNFATDSVLRTVLISLLWAVAVFVFFAVLHGLAAVIHKTLTFAGNLISSSTKYLLRKLAPFKNR